MSAAELDLGTLRRLAPVTEVGQVSVLLGAGASAAAGLPDWDSLATQLLQLSGTIDDEETARAFLARQDPALAAEAARAASGDWLDLVRRALYPEALGEPEPAALHFAVAALAAQRPVGEVGLFTLNFDLLLERALEDALEEVGSAAGIHPRDTEEDRAPRHSYEVHHLHGYLGRAPEEAGSIVLTLSDFTALSAEPRPWQVAELQNALSHGPLLLAGTSYRDPDVRQWLHDLKLASRRHQGFVLLAREGLGLDRRQFDRVKDALVAQWAAIGVQAVLVHDHSDAAQAIREMTELSRLDYRAPQLRAASLWQRHERDFRRLQVEHADQLGEDVEILRRHLGDDANMTLWLADGRGQLVRWASHDRLYRSPEQLRRVAVGHDSPWIAGQCLGVADVLARNLPGETATRRWRSVVAAPIVAALPEGPDLPTAVLSSAAPGTLEEQDLDAWSATLVELSEEWSNRLSALEGA
ncbi:SIR2-like domain-containing protein [Geodermatophilus amargosae]|uniref:SIR2-like domain-containing protein n=1 Tax=Geodermatophilus amargosae TaxID=1296565 RepID=A0A1I7AVS0_9ACTN|nr:SIR2 family protein [Geodermatophilus amargosae]SFT79004.1 SIR2-like domain-containing protein [Geodermatophilus amargosae]